MKKKIIACILAVTTLLVSIGLHTVLTIAEEPATPIKASVTNSLDGYAIGTQPAFATISDLGWRPPYSTLATAKISRGSSAHGSSKTLVFDADVAEGQGPYNGTPCLDLATNIKIDPATNTFMMYIKTPDIGTISPDPYPPKDWSVSFNAIQIKQDSTGQSGLRAHAWNGGFEGWKIDFLDISSNAWITFTMDGNGRILLPGKSEGWLKINMAKCPIFNSWKSGGLNANAEYTVDFISLIFGWVGGEYGSFDIGGFYTVTEDSNSTFFQLDTDAAPNSMTNSATFIEANLKADVSEKETGSAVDSSVVSISDLGWRPGTTAATATVGDAVVPNAENKSIVVSAPAAEGEAPNNATPVVSVYPYAKVSPKNHAIMFYLETPTYNSPATWGVRVKGLSYSQEGMADWFFSDFAEARYAYLPADGEAWSTGTADGNGTLALPSGFKGYVKLYLNTPANWYSADGFVESKEYQVNSVDFVFNTLGGEYGNFVIGGIYEVVADCNETVMSLGGAEEKSMTIFVDRIEAVLKYDFAANEIGSQLGGGLVSVSDLGWRPGTTQATVTMQECISIVTKNKAITLNSPVAEGEGPNNATPAFNFYTWTNVHSDVNAVMLYIETPKYSTSSSVKWSTRIKEMGFQQDGANWWFGSEFNNTEYAYLECDSNKWVKKTSDGNGTLDLPSGFKGYIKLYIDTCTQYANWLTNGSGFDPSKDYTMNNLTFVFGYLGGEYGAFKIGDVYEVTKDSEAAKIKLSGGPVVDMTTYIADNTALVNEFNQIVSGIGEITLADAAAVDRASAILNQLDAEFLGTIPLGNMTIYNAATAAVSAYRPAFLGATIRTPDAPSQAMKFGAEIDLAGAKAEGFTVKDYGMVALDEIKFDGKTLITANTDDVEVLAGEVIEEKGDNLKFAGVYEVANFADYGKNVIVRSYVTYYNEETKEEFTIYNSTYEYSDGTKQLYFKCNISDAAVYFNVSVMGN